MREVAVVAFAQSPSMRRELDRKSEQIGADVRRGMGAVACDLDGDGDIDIYVTNDAMPNNLWVNDGTGHFKDMATETGTAFGEGGQGVGLAEFQAADEELDGRHQGGGAA